jgi:hypothetical protein
MESPNPTAFSLFPELPSELRLKIWRFCFPGPRTVRIQYKAKTRHSVDGKRSNFSAWTSTNPIPIILHICHESRQEALKFYRLAFGSFFHQPSIYIGFDIDSVHFVDEKMDHPDRWKNLEPCTYLLDVLLGGEYYGSDDGEKIQRMVLDINESLYGRRSFCWDEIRLLPQLKELTLVAFDTDDMADELMRHFRETLGSVARAHPEWVVPDIMAVSVISGRKWGRVEVPHAEQSEE